jgi:FkbH-like protein
MQALKATNGAIPAVDAWQALLAEAREVSDYTRLLALCRSRRRLAAKAPRPPFARTVRVALLGGATTEMLEEPLVLSVEALGLGCELQSAAYNTFAQEMLEPSSATARFAPDVAVVVTTPANLPSWPQPGDNLERVCRLAEEVCDYWLGLCARLHEHARCEIVLNNFHPLPTRPLGNLGAKVPWDANNFVRRVNRTLGDRAPAYVHVNDVEALATYHGVNQWFDPRYWFHAKQPVSFACLVPYVRNTARVIAALFGRSAKCAVLDLDNTLWGGVVGDDGPEGIKIGEGDAVGEAFKAFQEYVLRLKQRGVLLAVCSKNAEANALAAFRERPEMVLKRDDFVSFVANWEPKPDNLRRIAAELNIGLDALVFVDDNPVERDQVRQRLPEVKVVELTADPADYPRLLDEAGWFEVTALSTEDQERTQQYHENQARQQLLAGTTDYAAYLTTLQQKAVVRPFEERHLDRITQLINKSNQFNLTTRRLSRSQVEDRMRDPAGLTAYVRLADRFGDNGLISVFAGRRVDDTLEIDLWLMSCRVLNRGVEQLLCNYAATEAALIGVRTLGGEYLPTAKNGLVRDHYKGLGFAAAGAAGDGTRWRLELDSFQPFDVAIEVVEDY